MTNSNDLVDAFTIMLKEAASRGSLQEAAYVISGILGDLCKDYPQFKELTRNWSELASSTSTSTSTIEEVE